MKFIVPLLAIAVILMSPIPDDPWRNCQSGVWRRHEAFGRVLSYFPQRIDFDVDGYVATISCNIMNRKGSLLLGSSVYTVSVADCYNRSVVPEQQYMGDIDDRLWWASGVHNAPVLATVCWDDNVTNN